MTVLVTGGSSGIGRAVASHFAALGHDLVINYRSDDRAAGEAAAAVEEMGVRAVLVKADVAEPAGVAEIAGVVGSATDSLHLFVHCAAMAVSGGALDIEHSRLARAIEVNATSLVSLVQGLLPVLRPGSSVVYLSSQGSTKVVPNYVALGPAKALGEALIRYLAVELAARGVRANTVSAGPLDTAAFRAMFGEEAQGCLTRASAANPSGRGVEFEDVVRAIELVTAADVPLLQGQTVMVDGGLSL